MFSLLLLCREPLPHREEGWRLDLGPVRIEPSPPTLMLGAMGDALGIRPAQVIRFLCPSFSAALVAEGVADVIGRATRGVLIDDATLAVLEDYEHERRLDPQELNSELVELEQELDREADTNPLLWERVAQSAG